MLSEIDNVSTVRFVMVQWLQFHVMKLRNSPSDSTFQHNATLQHETRVVPTGV